MGNRGSSVIDSALVLLPTRRGKRSNDAVTEHCSETYGE